MASVNELHIPDHFFSEKQKNPGEFGCSVPFITVIMKSHLFKIMWVFIPNRIGRRKVYVSVLFGHVSHQLWQNGPKCKFSTMLTTQDFRSSLGYVTRNATVSSSSITKSNLVISWPARKSVPSLDFLRCVGLRWVAPVRHLS